MKRILIFIDAYLPGTKSGGPVQSIKNIVELLKKDFDFYIITRNVDVNSNEIYEDIETNKLVKNYGCQIKYLATKDYYNISRIKEEIKGINPELIYLNGVYSKSSIYINFLRYIGVIKNKLLILPRGDLAQSARSKKQIKKEIFLSGTKLIKFYRGVFWQSTSLKEKKDIESFYPNAKIENIKNLKKIEKVHKNNTKVKNQLNLVTISRVHPIKNIKYVLEILEDIKLSKVEEINFDIYGPLEDSKYWEECQKIIKRLAKNIKVNYKGNLANERVLEKVSEYDFSIFPTLGENFGHSIVESIIAKTPVIISDQTPWRELENFNIGYDLSLNEKEKWKDAIKKIIKLEKDEYSIYIEKCEDFIKNKAGFFKETEKTKRYFNNIILK